MYFHHGIAGAVGDVGGKMNVMQETTEEEESLYRSAMLSEGMQRMPCIYVFFKACTNSLWYKISG